MSRDKRFALAVALVLFSLTITFLFLAPRFLASNEIEVIAINDRSYFDFVRNAIEKADDEVLVAMFELTYYSRFPNSSSNRLVQELAFAKERGVRVKVLLDSGNEIESVRKVNTYACKLLRKLGIDARMENSSSLLHAKFVVVDNELLILGSSNWNYHSLELNHETNVAIKSRRIAKLYKDYFNGLWQNSIAC